MARDGKLVFNFTKITSGNVGQMNVFNAPNAGTGNYGASVLSVPASTQTYGLVRGVSNALNRAGFRDQSADQSLIATTNSVTSAILNDPAVFGQTEMYEGYVRIAYGQLGASLAASSQLLILVEAASDSGTGTAGTDWTPVSGSVNVTNAARTLTVGSSPLTNGVLTISAGSGIQPGDVVSLAGGSITSSSYIDYQPFYVTSVNATGTSVVLSTTPNGAAAAISNSGTPTVYATPATGKRIIAMPLAPTAKPWLRLVAYSIGGGTLQNTGAGVWIQDAFVTISRDSAALA
jgi:hypothetical protein